MLEALSLQMPFEPRNCSDRQADAGGCLMLSWLHRACLMAQASGEVPFSCPCLLPHSCP